MLAIDPSLCLACGGCVPLCAQEALFLSFERLECDDELCNLCGDCIDFCPVGAIEERHAVTI
jgi:ferredoxin